MLLVMLNVKYLKIGTCKEPGQIPQVIKDGFRSE